ncbi:MAG: glycosyltransferase [Nitrososphaerales archaeon]
MTLVIDIFNVILLSITTGVLGTWIYLLAYITRSFRNAPKLDGTNITKGPKVSVIVPARNEEQFISHCLTTIGRQDYQNYNIVVVDDSSTDRTALLIKEYASHNDNIVFVDAGPKPDGWAGKNWACYQGYLRSDGDLLLFTDADTNYGKTVISGAVSKVMKEDLDALTLVPRLICIDRWTRITLPFLSTFLHSRYSPLRVNDPAHRIGYFFGSFYLIRRNIYEAIGTHSDVRNELVEDGALGSRVKKSGYKLKMFRGEHQVSAIWARDFSSLWSGLGRLIIPLYRVNKFQAVAVFLVSFFLFLAPFMVLPYSAFFLDNIIAKILLTVNGATCILIIISGMIEARLSLKLNMLYALAAPFAASIIALGFLSGVMKAGRRKGVKWRDRDYVYSQYRSRGFKL